jgi:hypothetical protein
MKPENATHCFDLDRFDEAGMRNSDRMQDTFEGFLPKPQKAQQLGEIWVEVVVLPEVALEQPGMVRAPVQDIRRKSCVVTRISRSLGSKFSSQLGYGNLES